MIITSVQIYAVKVPLRQTISYSNDRLVKENLSIILRVETREGVVGWGEICPAGRTYGAAFAEGALAALRIIAPCLIGLRCDEPARIQAVIDAVLSGHAYAKGPVMQACLDATAKQAGLPAYALLGGLVTDTVGYPGFIMPGTPDETQTRLAALREAGIRHFIPHGSGDVTIDLENAGLVHAQLNSNETMSVDGNGGYSRLDALRFIADLPKSARLVIEQPCASYDDCATVKRATGVPMVLDECMTGLAEMMRAWADGVLDGLKLKIDRVGGVWKARQMRDAAAELGVPLWVQMSAGTEISEAAMVHLAVSTPIAVLRGAGSLVDLNAHEIAATAITRTGAALRVGDRPGFGVEPDPGKLGAPVASFP